MRHQLHIQLGRQHKTTRHSRRVVWLLFGFFLVLTAFSAHTSSLWINRNTVFAAAPDGTQSAVHFLLNKSTQPILTKTLGTIPLISNRDITFEDITPFTHGEFALFLNEDKTRSLAIRTTQQEIPSQIFDAKHIVVQEIKPNVLLLSEKLQPVSGLKVHTSLHNLLPSFSSTLGSYFEKGFKNTTKISFSESEISIEIPKESKISSLKQIAKVPNNTFLVLSTPVLSMSESIQSLTQAFSGLTDPLLKEPLEKIFVNISQNNGLFALSNSEESSFYISSDYQPSQEERAHFVQTILAIKHPNTKALSLADGSKITEFISDPSLISLEERTIEGKVFLHATTGISSLFISKNDGFILSNSEDSIREWIQPSEESKTAMLCHANIGFMKISDVFNSENYSLEYYSNDLLYQLSTRFQSIGLRALKNKSFITLCL